MWLHRVWVYNKQVDVMTYMTAAGLESRLRRCLVTEQLIFWRARSRAKPAAWVCWPPAMAASKRRRRRFTARVFMLFLSDGDDWRLATYQITSLKISIFIAFLNFYFIFNEQFAIVLMWDEITVLLKVIIIFTFEIQMQFPTQIKLKCDECINW